MTDAYIGLGSNLNGPEQQLQDALTALKLLPDTQLLACSGFYQNPPLGPSEQDYVNAVAKLSTKLSAQQLLQHCQAIEIAQGRVRTQERWSSRTLDLDIIIFGQEVHDSQTLTIPHYDMQNRAFVLIPLYEVAGDLELPNGQHLNELVAKCDAHSLKLL